MPADLAITLDSLSDIDMYEADADRYLREQRRAVDLALAALAEVERS